MDIDFQYALDTILLDAAAETKLKYQLDFNGTIVNNIAIVNFDLDSSPRFQEKEWLEQNHIQSFSLDFNIQTWLPIDTADGFCIPKTLLMDFATKRELIDGTEEVEYDTLLQFTIDHYNQVITEK